MRTKANDPKSVYDWFFSAKDELHPQHNDNSDSFLVALVGIVFCVLRRVSPTEWLKHLFDYLSPYQEDPLKRGTPAWANDLFLALSWYLLWGVTFIVNEDRGSKVTTTFRYPLLCFVLCWIVQIIQGSLYHNIWRVPIFDKSHPMARGFSPYRTLIFSVCNFVSMCWLFGLAYWSLPSVAFSGKIHTVFDAIYFGFVTGATLGFGDIAPDIDYGWAQLLVVFQILSSLLLLAVVIAQAVSTVGNVFEITISCPLCDGEMKEVSGKYECRRCGATLTRRSTSVEE